MGLWSNANIGGAAYPTTLQTKPLYDCLCSRGYCLPEDPAAVSSVVVRFAIPLCYAISPQTSWGREPSGTPWTATTGTIVINGVTYALITVQWASILKYQAGAQIQIPLNSNCAGTDEFAGATIFSQFSNACTVGGGVSTTAWAPVRTSGTRFI